MTHQVFINEIVKASFNLCHPKSKRPINIYLIVRINQKQAKLSTGVKVYPEHWNIKKQEAYISCRLTESDNINNTITNKTKKSSIFIFPKTFPSFILIHRLSFY